MAETWRILNKLCRFYVGPYIMSDEIEERKSAIRTDLADYTRRAGGAALGARLRRLSDRIDRELSAVYADHGERLEQRWFGSLDLLDRFGPLAVGDLASALGITHVSVCQTRDSLVRANLVSSQTDAADGRRRLLTLTAEGRDLVLRLRPLWDLLSESARQLDEEAGGVVAALDRLEQALDRASVAERAQSSGAARHVQTPPANR